MGILQIERRGRFFRKLSGFRFRFPNRFPLLSTVGSLVGQPGKFRKATFDNITHSVNGYPHLTSKSDKIRRHKLDRPVIVHRN
jgi:hypothetical protein